MRTHIYTIIILLFNLSSLNVFSWGVDVQVSAGTPEGNVSVVTKSNGDLYASVPQTSLNPSYAMTIYHSTDNGANWTQLNTGGGSPGSVVVKSKMLRTGTDKIVCVYQIGNSLFTLDVDSGIVTPFTTIGCDDFDVSASSAYNSIYLFVQEAGTSSVKRYSSSDAGLTWGGTTATVTSNGANPKVYMSGSRLNLSYYGTLMPDVKMSRLVTASYDESGPGTLAVVNGSFIDIVTNTTVQKHEFTPVNVNGNVWFLWTEGNGPSVLKGRFSSTNGTTYGTEFTIAGTGTTSIQRFDAKHFSNLVSQGVMIAYYADSATVALPDANSERIEFITAPANTPQTFSTPQRVSDHMVDASSPRFNVSMVSYTYMFSETAGVLWTEDSGTGPGLYFDSGSSTVTGLSDRSGNASSVQVFPNPFREWVNVTFSVTTPEHYMIELVDPQGRIVYKADKGFLYSGNHMHNIMTPELSPGIYLLRLLNASHISQQKLLRLD